MTNPEDLKALVAELREHVRYRYMPASARVAMERAADALEARMAVPERAPAIEPWRIMTPEEYAQLRLVGPYAVHRDFDGAGNTAVWLGAQGILAMLSAAPGDGGGDLGLSQGGGDARLDPRSANQSQQGGSSA